MLLMTSCGSCGRVFVASNCHSGVVVPKMNSGARVVEGRVFVAPLDIAKGAWALPRRCLAICYFVSAFNSVQACAACRNVRASSGGCLVSKFTRRSNRGNRCMGCLLNYGPRTGIKIFVRSTLSTFHFHLFSLLPWAAELGTNKETHFLCTLIRISMAHRKPWN